MFFIYIYIKQRKYVEKKVDYWRVRMIKKRRFILKIYLLIQILFFKEKEIQSSHKNKLKKVFRKIKLKILVLRELYKKFHYILMK